MSAAPRLARCSYMFTHTHARVCKYMCVWKYVCTYCAEASRGTKYIYVYVYVYVCVCVCVCVFVCEYTYTYIHTCVCVCVCVFVCRHNIYEHLAEPGAQYCVWNHTHAYTLTWKTAISEVRIYLEYTTYTKKSTLKKTPHLSTSMRTHACMHTHLGKTATYVCVCTLRTRKMSLCKCAKCLTAARPDINNKQLTINN
jgi:hypothetical protein